jgi:outer membrane protein assembly factor BamB
MTRIGLALLAGVALVAAAACSGFVDTRAPWEHAGDHDIGRPVLGFRWKKVIADHSSDYAPQEFAAAGVAPLGAAETDEGKGTVYVGSHAGWFLALRDQDGGELWRRNLGPMSGVPLATRAIVYVGTDEGVLYALDAHSGAVKWQYTAKGAILRPPVIAGDQLLFSTDNNHVISLDRDSGKWRWQYDRETPEEFTLRGHAGVTVEGERCYSGFADGHVVALTLARGEVVWVRSLAGDQKKFVDVDTTPVVRNGVVYAASAAGGLYGLDAGDGTERWHVAIEGASQLIADEAHLYAAAAETGLMALDFAGHLLWRQGFHRAGDPGRPVVDGDYLFLSVSERGLYIVDKRDGSLLQSFNPGPGVSTTTTLAHNHAYFMSNGGILYAMQVRR